MLGIIFVFRYTLDLIRLVLMRKKDVEICYFVTS